jgi:hypothetical protein
MAESRGLGKIPLKGITGFLFVVAICVLILIEVPAARWFLAGSAVLGGVVGVALYLWNSRAQ